METERQGTKQETAAIVPEQRDLEPKMELAIEKYDADRFEGYSLDGFFVGWKESPGANGLKRVLDGSTLAFVAVDHDEQRIVGFKNALSDGVLTAYIPLLEILPEHQGKGIGSKLVAHMFEALGDLYMVDIVCDEELVPFYERFGMIELKGMALRNYSAQSGRK